MNKQWYLSKTLWLNAITLILSVVGLVIDQPWLPPKVVLFATSILLPVLNMILRLLTSQSIAKPGETPTITINKSPEA